MTLNFRPKRGEDSVLLYLLSSCSTLCRCRTQNCVECPSSVWTSKHVEPCLRHSGILNFAYFHTKSCNRYTSNVTCSCVALVPRTAPLSLKSSSELFRLRHEGTWTRSCIVSRLTSRGKAYRPALMSRVLFPVMLNPYFIHKHFMLCSLVDKYKR